MKFLNCLVACIVTFLVGPFTVSAAIERLPIGSAEVLIEDARSRVDEIRINIGVVSSNYVFIGNTYNTGFTSHTLANGSEESIEVLARRSLAELEAFIGAELKKGAEATITANAAKLVGRRLYAAYSLGTPIISGNPWRGGHNLMDDDYYSDVFQTAPKTSDSAAFRRFRQNVSLTESVKWIADYRTYPLTVPGIARAQMTEEDENGNSIRMTDSVEATLNDVFSTVYSGVPYPLVYHEDDTLFVPLFFVLSGKGTLRIWYRDGSEQVFRRQDGENLITYLSPPLAQGSPFKRLGVPGVTGKEIAIPYESRDDEEIHIEFSADFRNWVAYLSLPVYPPRAPTGAQAGSASLVRIRTATAPKVNGYGFYRARITSPTAPQAAQRR